MIKKLIPFYATLIVILLIAGCKGDTGPAGLPLSGSMTGFVTLFQSDGSRAANQSGVTVSVQGTSFSTTTDSIGQWTISGITTGTYTITYTKLGYGMSEQEGLEFVGGGVAYYVGKITMAQPPNFSVALNPSLTIADSNALYVSYTSGGVPKGTEIEVLIAVGTDASVSALDPTKYLYSVTYLTLNTSGASNILESTLQAAGFTSGMTAYVVAYPLCYYNGGLEYSSYLDHTTGRTAYTSHGAPSQVIPLTVP